MDPEIKLRTAYASLTVATQRLGGDFALIDAVLSDSTIAISGHAYDCSRRPAAASAQHPSTATVEERLRVLEDLKTKGLITPEEYAAKRGAILGEL